MMSVNQPVGAILAKRVDGSLRKAFIYDVRPDAYLTNAWWTAVLFTLGLFAYAAYRPGAVDPSLAMPVSGWHTRNPEGVLYVELWANIVANAIQASFGFWGGWLFLLGLGRIVFSRTYVKTCFSLGAAFVVVAVATPYLVAALTNLIADKFPTLLN
jgi:hypothetical protein